MTEYRIRDLNGRKVHSLAAQPPRVRQEPERLVRQPCLPAPVQRRAPALWQLPAALLFELVLLGLVYQMLDESLDLVGVSLSKHLIDDPIIGWIFASVPGLTPRQVLALVMATLFVGVPVYVWSDLIDDCHDAQGSFGRSVVRMFLLAVYAAIVVAEYVLIAHRIEAVQNNAFGSQVTLNPTVATFFSVLFILVNATAALVTSSLLRGKIAGRR